MPARVEAAWPSGLRRWFKAPVFRGVSSNLTAVSRREEESASFRSTHFLSPTAVKLYTHRRAKYRACQGSRRNVQHI